MLKPVAHHAIFVTTFFASLVLLLAVALEGAGVITGERELVLGSGLFNRLQVNIRGAGVFLLLSGFLPAYIMLYLLILRKLHRVRRTLFGMMVFAVSFALLSALIGESIGDHEVWLFSLGVASVLVSDAMGELARTAVTRHRGTAG
jgi:hypothetical protein